MDSGSLRFRIATSADVAGMELARAPDHEAGPADPRMTRYLAGEHHPQKALPPRVAFAAMEGDSIVGYVGGHETTRYDCEGELQYLYVVPGYRRTGVASELLRLLANWFGEQGVKRVCVGADEENAVARSFLAHHGAQMLKDSFLTWSEIGEVLAD